MNNSPTMHMAAAIELARRGEGRVEPNPMVGCVIVRDGAVVGEGWHEFFGGSHAEIHALRAAGDRAAWGTAYVTLEPCSHFGKTPPCTEALIRAKLDRVVVAMVDPFPQVAGRGIAALEAAGIAVEVGLLEVESRRLNAPYLKRLATGRPWIMAKWAMTLDGKIATRSGNSRWISNEHSRAIAHQLRGRADAILVGRRTVELDDPVLTARPPGPRLATRVVVDTSAQLSLGSALVKSVEEAPVLVATGDERLASESRCEKLAEAGCEIFRCAGVTHAERLKELLDELGRRQFTNVLVEGGSQLLGGLMDAGEVDEVHVFVAPKLVGGAESPSPVSGEGVLTMALAHRLTDVKVERLPEDDLYIRGHVK